MLNFTGIHLVGTTLVLADAKMDRDRRTWRSYYVLREYANGRTKLSQCYFVHQNLYTDLFAVLVEVKVKVFWDIMKC